MSALLASLGPFPTFSVPIPLLVIGALLALITVDFIGSLILRRCFLLLCDECRQRNRN